MSFVRYKGINNKNGGKHYYLYEVESNWIKGKGTRQKVIKYIGKSLQDNILSIETIKAVMVRDGYACQKCPAKTNLEIDHIVPLLDGGTNNADNLQVLCGTCNKNKGRKLLTKNHN